MFRASRQRADTDIVAWSQTSYKSAKVTADMWEWIHSGTTKRTGRLSCEITTNIMHVLPAPLLERSTFSGVSLKTLLVLSHRLHLPSKSCAPAWRIKGLLTSSLRPAMAFDSLPDLIIASRNGSRATVCGRPPRQPQHCSALFHECSRKMDPAKCNRLRRSSASFTMFSISSLAVRNTHNIHERPPNSFHRHVLQPFALPRRVIALTSQRAVHACRITIESTRLSSL